MGVNKLYPEFFRRLDERPDALFYTSSERDRHVNELESLSLKSLYDELLPATGHVLDLMAGRRSHLSKSFENVVGLGLNETDLRENAHTGKILIHDVNLNARLPLQDKAFDGVICSGRVQYMTRPDDIFPDVARILKHKAPFIVTFSNQMHPTKAILAWRASDEAAHIRLVKSYFAQTKLFSQPCVRCLDEDKENPLYAVWAYKQGAIA